LFTDGLSTGRGFDFRVLTHRDFDRCLLDGAVAGHGRYGNGDHHAYTYIHAHTHAYSNLNPHSHTNPDRDAKPSCDI
jgi:hypothetical protein